MSTASGHSLFNQLNPVTHTGTLCDLPSPESRTWPQSSSSRDPAGPHKHTMHSFKSTAGIPSHSNSPGNQALCTIQENLQDYIADTLCCIEGELQMLLFAPPEYQRGDTPRAPVRNRSIPWQLSSRGAAWIHSQEGNDGKVQAQVLFQIIHKPLKLEKKP